MGKIVLYMVLGLNGFAALRRPWIGIIVAYFFAVLGPQYIWWWHFQGVRHFLMVAVPTILGFLFYLFSGNFDGSPIKTKVNLYMAVLWLFMVLSYYFGPYVDIPSQYRFNEPARYFSMQNKVFIFYFIAVILISDTVKIKCFFFVMIISSIYLVYWANMEYLDGRWFGRLSGPIGFGSLYGDENNFALFFVTSIPFLYYWGVYFQKLIPRLLIWLIIPLGWHAIFLTGSRGGILGIAATMLVILLRSQRKFLGILLIPIFLIVYQWQGGPVMKDRAETISEYDQDRSASSRIEAWEAAINMIKSNPITGVGLCSFGPAFPYYSDKQPREAHNTFFQISSESGIIAGMMYIFIFLYLLSRLLKNGDLLRRIADISDEEIRSLYLINETVLVAFVGLSVCSFFLSMQFFEIYYYIVILGNAVLYVSSKKINELENQ